MFKINLLLFISCLFCFCSGGTHSNETNNADSILVDKNASIETKNLFISLKKLSGHSILFGQEEATAYGIDWKNEDLKCDINDICGRFPALYGWNLGYMDEDINIDSVSYSRMIFWIVSAFERGGINTISTYIKTPKSSFKTPKYIQSNEFKIQLRLIANYLNELKTKSGINVPILLRLFPDSKNDTYWWGALSDIDYKNLYQFSVKYLIDSCKIHNILLVYSSSDFDTEKKYLDRFPGFEYVDILGFDNMKYLQPPYRINKSLERVRLVVKLAEENKKLGAITNSGLNLVSDSTWFMSVLLNPIKNDPKASHISYVLLSSNRNKSFFNVPYLGHKGVKDFIQFENDPVTMFEDDLPSMYQDH